MRHLGPMSTGDFAGVTSMLFRAVAPAAVPIGQANYGIAGTILTFLKRMNLVHWDCDKLSKASSRSQ